MKKLILITLLFLAYHSQAQTIYEQKPARWPLAYGRSAVDYGLSVKGSLRIPIFSTQSLFNYADSAGAGFGLWTTNRRLSVRGPLGTWISYYDKVSVDSMLALTGSGVSSITGTSNQVVASASTGAVTLSLPQSIATTSSPTFGGLNIGGSLTGATEYNASNITGATTAYGNYVAGTVQSGVTSNAFGYATSLKTQATSFTLASLNHYYASQGTIGAGSTVTNQFAFRAESTLTGASGSNIGFCGSIAAGTNRWNIWMNGTAQNWMAGKLGLGTSMSVPTALLHLAAGTATANTAPIKLTAGTNLTTPEVGAIEFDGTDLFYTVTSGTTRRTVVNLLASQTMQNKTLSTGSIWNGNVIGGSYINPYFKGDGSTKPTVKLNSSSFIAGSGSIAKSGNFQYNGNNIFLTDTLGNDHQIAYTTDGTPVTNVTSTPVTMSVTAKMRYVISNASLVTLTLPSTAAIGDEIYITGYGAGGWHLAQNSGQQIHSASNSTLGVTGYIESTAQYNSVLLVCTVANTHWVIQSSQGTITTF